jgi:phosphoribosylamine--glycine ligase/phosphoribosylformylglycinamidine cyclo-ligase
MKLLVIGGGGREHALVWKLAQSEKVTKIFVAPGNGGTTLDKSENVKVSSNDVEGLVKFATENKIDFTIVGPEEPLSLGVVNAFQKANLKIFGPTRNAARLETSKVFAKNLMMFSGVPTASSAAFQPQQEAQAISYIEQQGKALVVKASGLAAGKGVIVCNTADEAKQAVKRILTDKEFGEAGKQILIEERLTGKEVSVMAFCDGKTVKLMPPVRDHKRVFDNDEGPNTGGMGAFTPLPDVDAKMLEGIRKNVLEPTVAAMNAQGTPYQGVLYAGIMLTPDGPRVLEFNCRFGDPETQVVLPLLKSDLLEVLLACVNGTLDKVDLEWSKQACVTVVAASKGYPGEYPKGLPITLPITNELIFQAGTTGDGHDIVTSGGRVLAVSSVAHSLEEARDAAYETLSHLEFDGIHYRKDIGLYAPEASYAAAGVSIDAGNKAVDLMKNAVKASYTKDVIGGVGSFGGMFDAKSVKDMKAPVLVVSTDGVGTKTKVAARLKRWHTIGRDLVNHCVNDILVQGASPLFFVDYVASSKLEPEVIADVVSGCAHACRELGFPLIGGETAEMPGVYVDGEIDLAGTIVGTVEKEHIIDGSKLAPGDVLLALPSTGLHTNGYSLARRALDRLDWTSYRTDLNGNIGDALMAVHRPYLYEIKNLLKNGLAIKGLAHITGGGIVENLPRILPNGVGAAIERGRWPEPPIFKLIQQQGRISDAEMFRAFNMGIGMILVIAAKDLDRAQHLMLELRVVGRLVAGQKTVTIN